MLAGKGGGGEKREVYHFFSESRENMLSQLQWNIKVIEILLGITLEVSTKNVFPVAHQQILTVASLSLTNTKNVTRKGVCCDRSPSVLKGCFTVLHQLLHSTARSTTWRRLKTQQWDHRKLATWFRLDAANTFKTLLGWTRALLKLVYVRNGV